jgi:hypothetical protein
MTEHRALFSAHFDRQKSTTLESTRKLSNFMARFATVHESRSHRTKQIRTLMTTGENEDTYERRMGEFDPARSAVKKMLADAKAVGYPADAPPYVNLFEARANITALLAATLIAWREAKNAGWSNDAGEHLLRSIVSRYAEINTAIKTFKDSMSLFRVELTKHLSSAAFRQAAGSDEFRAKLAQIQADPPPAKARRAPVARAARADEDDEGGDGEEPNGIDLGEFDSEGAGDDDEEEDEDLADVVDDDAPIVREQKQFFDEVSMEEESSHDGDDEEEESEEDDDDEETESEEIVAPVRVQRSQRKRSATFNEFTRVEEEADGENEDDDEDEDDEEWNKEDDAEESVEKPKKKQKTATEKPAMPEPTPPQPANAAGLDMFEPPDCF